MRRTAHLLCALLLLLVPACGLLLEKGREVVAEVGDEPIRLNDFLLRVRSLSFEERAKANDSNPEISMQTRRAILEQMVAERLMILEAKDRGIRVSDEEVEQELERALPPEEMEENRAEETREGAQRHEEHRHQEAEIDAVRDRLLIKKLKEEEISDKAIQEYYNAHLEEDYRIDPPIVLYEIATVARENKSIADELYRLGTEEGMPLSDAYAAMGSPKEVLEGGIATPIELDKLVPSMQEIIRNLKVDEVSKPFPFTANGKELYVIVKLLRRMTKEPLRLVKDEVRQKMALQLISKLEKKYGIRYYYDKLNYRAGD